MEKINKMKLSLFMSMMTKLQLIKFYFQTAPIYYREEKKFYR